MSRLAALKSAASRDDVATLLETSRQGLASILYMKPIAARYTTFEIPKKSGGTRVIKAPDERLKLLQKKLSVLLQDCLEEFYIPKIARNGVAQGFKRECSICTNADRHRNRRWVFNLDLQDFFPSIHFGRVRGFFIKDRNFALHKDVATVLAQIACDGNALPQGSPCSPVISNLIAHSLDMHLVSLATKVGCTYSRYADDLTFSTKNKQFPMEIAFHGQAEPLTWSLGKELEEIIHHSDFKVNAKKTRMQYRDSRQEVTGLIVSRSKINVRCEYRHNVRAMVHRLFRTGSFQLYGAVTKAGATTLEKRDGSLNELHGRLSFINSIDLHNKEKADAQNKKKAPKKDESHSLSTKESMYRHFLIYRDFYIAEKPVILCEGKTDNTYIKHAIRSLANDFPELAEIDTNGEVRIKVRLYKYTESSTGRILGLNSGGSSHSKNFITTYKEHTDKFLAPGLKNPLILLFDNDSGASAIRGAAKEARPGKKHIDPNEPFTKVVKNLYILPTPPVAGQKESSIEDFFDAPTKATIIRGKTFNGKNISDNTKHYSKAIFAEEVVAKHAKSIDFSGFIPLLQNISLIIQEHAKNVASQKGAP